LQEEEEEEEGPSARYAPTCSASSSAFPAVMAETNGNPNIVIGSFARINGFFPSPRTFTDAFIAAYGSTVPLPLPPRPSNSQNQKGKKSTKSAKDRERARESSKERAKKELARAREGEREK
jgi:hypothetical protein